MIPKGINHASVLAPWRQNNTRVYDLKMDRKLDERVICLKLFVVRIIKCRPNMN